MRPAPRAAACGTWFSPVSAASVAAGSVRLMQPRAAGDYVYWVESRPAEHGRYVLVRSRPGELKLDLTPPPFSVRSRVHEYGGGAYAVSSDRVFFVNDSDQQIHCLPAAGGAVSQLTGEENIRFADLLADERRQRLICVCEAHTATGQAPRNSLVAVSLRDGRLTTLAQGKDFYSSPALSLNGGQLAWLAWNQPQMPWDGCELWLAELDGEGAPQHARCIAGGTDESVFQPQFSSADRLHFISDRNGFWNIYKYEKGKTRAVTHAAMDHGFAQWQFGMSSYGCMRDGTLLAARCHRGGSELVQIGTDGETKLLPAGCTQIEHVQVTGNRCALLASDPSRLPAIFLGDGERFTPLTEIENRLPTEYASTPEFISFATSDGETAHAWYYPPHNADFSIPHGEQPPLLVKCHGGPTAMNGNGLEPRIQFWSSRGFAVVDVNYRGSSGFGRAYRRSLYGHWGIKDAEDCIAAARYLAERGLADANRLIISGSSAGGFTTLCTLAFHAVFRTGAVYYGLSELETAMRDTHKFEAHYGAALLGPWPQARDIYRARSPRYAAEHINCPVIFFQGLEDRVVPPDQTLGMVQALRARKLPVAYLSFAGEGHGFRRAATIQRTLESELAFYARIFGFTPADTLPPLCIENLPEPD